MTAPHTPPGAAPSRGPVLGDRRGLTTAGAVLVVLLVGSAGALADVLTGNGLRELFAVGFVTGCVVAAMTVHREDLFASVVLPPLVYVVLVLAFGLLDRTATSGSFLSAQAIVLLNGLVLGAPVLGAATLAAAVVATLRALR